MSRVGKMPIEIPQGIDVDIKGNTVTAKGQKGELSVTIHPDISVNIDDNFIKADSSFDIFWGISLLKARLQNTLIDPETFVINKTSA